MSRFLLLLIHLIPFSFLAQEAVVKGRIVDTYSSEVIPDAYVVIQATIFNSMTNAEGMFNFVSSYMPEGEQVLLVSKPGYITQRIPITIQNGRTINLDPILLELDLSALEAQIGIISLSDNELDEDDGTSFNVSGLLSASKDVFLNAASYDFSATFFRPRGYDSENGAVLINGIKMNKLYDGRPQWGNWGGLNDVQRNQVFSMGLSANDYTFGDLAGTTNMIMRASQYRQGGRVSYATSNRSYRGRVMGSYHSGLMLSGWAYSVLISRRFGDEGIREGTLYDANSIFASVEKKMDDAHSLNITAFYTPNRRGKSSPNTQEVTDLKGVNYNSYWGVQDGEKRNARIKEVEEPVLMLNHYWNLSEKSSLNTNLAYQFGSIGNSRLGYDNVPNPDPIYYQYLPSYFLANPNGANLEGAYNAYRNLTNEGQVDWNNLYETNIFYGGTSRYYLYEDRVDDKQFTINTIYLSELNENITINASLNYKSLSSHNFANMIDLLGGNGYLDIDTFNTGAAAQPDLNNPDRVVYEDEIIKYNYEINGSEAGGFAQGQFKYKTVDFYVALEAGQTSYQRNGLFKNGSFEETSEGESEKVNFTTYGLKAGLTYKFTGRHLFTLNSAYFTDAPTIRNTFSNSRQNNSTVVGLTEEKNTNFDVSYIFRSPIVKARITGYYTSIQDASEISFYYADGISGQGDNTTAFVQEVLTGVNKQNIGTELGIEAQVTPTIKLKAAAAYGEHTYQKNPNLYLTSEDFTDELIDYGEAYLENYRVSGGPQQAYQIGFEYRDPDFWWVGATTNYFSNSYVDVSPLNRTKNFYLDTDGLPFNEYDAAAARALLKQEKFNDYMLVNVVGGKSWRVNNYYVGFFATVNNIFNQEYKTGGFEQGRNANFRTLSEDTANDTRVFGPKYFYGYGTTYYVNVYIRM